MDLLEKTELENDISQVTNKVLLPFSCEPIYNCKDFRKTYFITNENLHFFDGLDTNNINNALTVLGSGDQLFNLVYKGVNNIETFDKNKMALYFALGIKKTAIEVLNYQQFLSFFENINEPDNSSNLEYIISSSETRYRKFWESIVAVIKEYDLSLFCLCYGDIKKLNAYCKDEQSFLTTKQNLKEAKINFKHLLVQEIPDNYDFFDFIYLSNIMDYYSNELTKVLSPNDINSLKLALINSIKKNNLSSKGQIYLYNMGNIIYNHFLNGVSYKINPTDQDLVLSLTKEKNL